MIPSPLLRLLLLVGGAVLLGACASRSTPPPPVDPLAARIAAAAERLRQAPDDYDAVCDLGVLLYRSGDLPRAIPVLRRAHRLRITEPRAIAYLGLALRESGDDAAALATFAKYTQVTLKSPYFDWLKGSYRLMVHRTEQRELIRRLSDFRPGTAPAVIPGRLASGPFVYYGDSEAYAGLDLALMFLVRDAVAATAPEADLVSPMELFVAARAAHHRKLAIDPSARGIAAFFGASRLVRGGFNRSNDHQWVVDYAVWEAGGQAAAPVTRIVDEAGLVRLTEELAGRLRGGEGGAAHLATRNWQAIVALGRGLAAEVAGDYSTAAHFHAQALRHDRDLAVAEERLEITRLFWLAGRDPDAAAGHPEPETGGGEPVSFNSLHR